MDTVRCSLCVTAWQTADFASARITHKWKEIAPIAYASEPETGAH